VRDVTDLEHRNFYRFAVESVQFCH